MQALSQLSYGPTAGKTTSLAGVIWKRQACCVICQCRWPAEAKTPAHLFQMAFDFFRWRSNGLGENRFGPSAWASTCGLAVDLHLSQPHHDHFHQLSSRTFRLCLATRREPRKTKSHLVAPQQTLEPPSRYPLSIRRNKMSAAQPPSVPLVGEKSIIAI
jgi:hypothetical protein